MVLMIEVKASPSKSFPNGRSVNMIWNSEKEALIYAKNMYGKDCEIIATRVLDLPYIQSVTRL